MKPRLTKEEIELLDSILGQTDTSHEKEGFTYFTCKCGQIEHKETVRNGERVFICSKCGDEYYMASSIREMEQAK